MLDRLDETIVAVSSAPGYGALGIVRLCGGDALRLADQMAVIEGRGSLGSSPGAMRLAGEVRIDDDLCLPATFYLFRKPRSYTRQDIVEIQTIGSPAVLEVVRKAAIKLGALPAEPGEFTARAFLNGAMDLGTAEAVAGVIRAQTDTQLRAARRLMDGQVASDMTRTRNELAELLALIEADIDFAEEPIDFITPSELQDRLGQIRRRLTALAAGSVEVERFDALPHILLFGPPNVGKSSLMNRISGTRRAICAAASGTTRDILSAPVRLGRCEAILLDAAGVDQSQDEVIAQARAKVLSETERVDVVCVVVDLAQPYGDSEFVRRVQELDVSRWVVVANKCDLVSAEELERYKKTIQAWALGPVYVVSALTGTGIESLRIGLAEAIGSTETTTLGETAMLSHRQRLAVDHAVEAIGRAEALSTGVQDTIDCADLLAVELREALDALGRMTGEVTTEDLLGQVFANFCIGK